MESAAGVEDMISLSVLREGTILENLKKRYQKDLIYTYVGSILISVNPFKDIPSLYSMAVARTYSQQGIGSRPPHVFAIIDNAYQALIENRQNQAIIMSGESGSGKTETSKIILNYLSLLKESKSDVERMVLESSPILEAFGNAKTLRNANSSRFGKFMDIQFDVHGYLCGASINQYLLEKNRITSRAEGERSYHIFYHMMAGLDSETRAEFELKDISSYHYINHSKCIQIPGLNDAEMFGIIEGALGFLGIDAKIQRSIWRILAAILHLGNVQFLPNAKDGSTIANPDVLLTVAKLLRIDLPTLSHALLHRVSVAKGETMNTPLKVEESKDNRDALAKVIYQRIFEYLVIFINKKLNSSNVFRSIGVLDIFGFEKFQVNSFEQFCINYANERLQQYFTEHIFKLEQGEYRKEGISWSDIRFLDNGPLIELIEKKLGIIAIMDEEARFPSGTDESLLLKFNNNHSSNPLFELPKMHKGSFLIRHYAGEVIYFNQGFLHKNRDTLQPELVATLHISTDPFLSELFDNTDLKTKVTLATQFKSQLTSLMATLSTRNPYHVRCLKPNDQSVPNHFDDQLLFKQLAYTGMLDTIRIRKGGYFFRMFLKDFFDRYKILVPKLRDAPPSKESIEKLLTSVRYPSNLYQIGQTKIFFRHIGPLNEMRKRIEAVMQIQSFWRMVVCRIRYLAERSQVVTVQSWSRMRRIRRNYLITRDSAIILQDAVRHIALEQKARKEFNALKMDKMRTEEEQRQIAEDKRRAADEERRRIEAIRKEKEKAELADRMRLERELAEKEKMLADLEAKQREDEARHKELEQKRKEENEEAAKKAAVLSQSSFVLSPKSLPQGRFGTLRKEATEISGAAPEAELSPEGRQRRMSLRPDSMNATAERQRTPETTPKHRALIGRSSRTLDIGKISKLPATQPSPAPKTMTMKNLQPGRWSIVEEVPVKKTETMPPLEKKSSSRIGRLFQHRSVSNIEKKDKKDKKEKDKNRSSKDVIDDKKEEDKKETRRSSQPVEEKKEEATPDQKKASLRPKKGGIHFAPEEKTASTGSSIRSGTSHHMNKPMTQQTESTDDLFTKARQKGLLLATPAQQMEQINQLLANDSPKPADVYYIINAKWWRLWKMFVKEYQDVKDRSVKPDEIENKCLLENPDEEPPLDKDGRPVAEYGLLKANLRKVEYQIVPASVWNKLKAWYGGGPGIARKIVSRGFIAQEMYLELYPLHVRVNKVETDTMVTYSFSPTTTVKEVRRLVAAKFATPLLKCRLFLFHNELTTEENMSKTLEELGVQDHQILLTRAHEEHNQFGATRRGFTEYNGLRPLENEEGSPIGKGGVGFHNLGNTSYMNAVLQNLIHTKLLKEYFLGGDYLKNINVDNKLGMKGELAKQFALLVQNVWSDKFAKVSPVDFKATFIKSAPQFSGLSQHDPGEMYTYVMNGLHEDLKKVMLHIETSKITDWFQGQSSVKMLCSGCAYSTTDDEPYMSLSLPIPTKNQRFVKVMVIKFQPRDSPVVYGVRVSKSGTVSDLKESLKQATQCSNFKIVEVYQDREWELKDSQEMQTIAKDDVIWAYEKDLSGSAAASILDRDLEPTMHPSTKREVIDPPMDLLECFRHYTAREVCRGDQQWHCPRCDELKDATKKTTFQTFPEILVVQLPRFQRQEVFEEKLPVQIIYPTLLDLSEFNGDSYNLFGAVIHLGDEGSGQYSALAKSPLDDQWYRYDDGQCEIVDEQAVISKDMQKDVCMLFYKRNLAVVTEKTGVPQRLRSMSRTTSISKFSAYAPPKTNLKVASLGKAKEM